MRLVVLLPSNGTGTNLRAIQEGIKQGTIHAEIAAVISDADVTKETLLPTLQKHNPDYVCLTGWKQMIPEEVILNFKLQILNIHPGLIPDSKDGVVKNPDGTSGLWNKGLFKNKAIQNFLDQKATYAGSSIHFLTHEFDFGPVLARCFEKINPDDTVETLYARLKVKENQLWQNVFSSLETADAKTH
ncbi:MAG: formyltransferase family protein [Patescibacteria group bacterium]